MAESKEITLAPNGVRWQRKPGGTSTASQFIEAQKLLTGDWVARQWNWWREGQPQAEDDTLLALVLEWEATDPPPPPGGLARIQGQWEAERAESEEARLARKAGYNHELASARIRMLQNQADAGFMRHVLARPANDAQRAAAERKLAACEQEAAPLAAKVGNPDDVADSDGYLPPERRDWHLPSLLAHRHGLLRALDKNRLRQRFKTVLAMPPPDPAGMCSECEAPSEWHTWGVSLCLFRGKPEPGSQAAALASLIPGWWERCTASTTYQLAHQWGHDTLPDFDGDQWQAMLPPLLRAWLGVRGEPAPKPDPRIALERRLKDAEAEAERVRRQIADLDR
jgi:hypothetical protein